MLTYRLLPVEEWGKLEHFFTEHGVVLPHPDLALIAVAEDEGVIVAHFVKQLVAHLEPLEIQEPFRGKVSVRRLTVLLGGTQNTFAFPETESQERMCQYAGFVKFPFPGYKCSKPTQTRWERHKKVA